MKKNRKYISKTVIGLFSSVALAFFSSCDIGLGPAVDMSAPEIEITSHKDNDSVGSIFAIRGTAIDNEKVVKITIDCPDADIHYQIVPGSGTWQKKTSSSQVWQTIADDSSNYCKINGNNIEWSIGFDSNERIPSKTDSSYTIEANAADEAGNSGRKSKAVCTITIDENNPIVEIYKPELSSGLWEDVESRRTGYKLKDGNIISRLMNGTLVLQGRLSNAISFKALRIEFDDGKQQSGVAKYTSGLAVDSMSGLISLPESNLNDTTPPIVYYTKDLTDIDFREWSITVNPEEWVTSENGLSTGSHVIRVVSSCLSASNAWERKILGYFVWWPEADAPWLTAPTGNADENNIIPVECYPGSSISGSAQDDDGIQSIVSTMYVKESDGSYKEFLAPDNRYKTTVTHKLPQENAKYSAWAIEVPSMEGFYKYTIVVTDLNGNSATETRYFKTSDVSAPKIEIVSPEDNTSAILNDEGNLSFNVTATDDGQIKLFALAWLNPALRSDSANKIKYLTGTDENWKNATSDGWIDDKGNIIYRLDDGSGKNIFELKNRIFNLYNQDKRFGFNIGGKDRNGKNIPLCAQDFIFLASDGGKNTVKAITLSGDNITPEKFNIKEIEIDGVKKNWNSGVPIFPSSAYAKEAVITGEWKDMLTYQLENRTRIYNPEVSWGDTSADSTILKSDGTWEAKIKVPAGGGTITATLKDFGGNTKVIQKAASIETSESGLSRIDCRTDDGSYRSGDRIEITLEFTKNVDVDTAAGIPTLTLNNGGTAIYVSGSGTTSHVFIYTVGNENDTDNLYVTAIDRKGAVWKENGTNADITDKVAVDSRIGDNIKSTRKIKIDNTAPKVKSIKPLSSSGNYKAGASLLFMLEFDEDVTVEGVSGLNMQFDHINNGNSVKTQTSAATGSRYVLLTYNVKDGDNADILGFSQLNASSEVKVTDAAGNMLSDWNISPVPFFEGFKVDTQKPVVPSFGSWTPDQLITSEGGTAFTLSGEQGASVEYSLDDGVTWMPYTGEVIITNNGTYNVTARQTDKAGNVSDKTETKSFTVNKGDLFKRITADSRSGIYTDSKTGSPAVITGKIEFRTAVKIAKGAEVTLNVSRNVPLNECISADAENDTFTFNYEVKAGDYIAENGKLDVIAWSFNSVKLEGKEVRIDFPSEGKAQRLKENRDIKILTGRPVKVGNTTFNGEGKDAVLVINLNRSIEKGTGDIIFEYDDSLENNKFLVPTVLTAEEYGELSTNTTIKNAYAVGMNGATRIGTKLVNDTTTKYILNYGTDNNNEELKAAFKSLNKHKVTVPVISDQVEVTGPDRNTLRITLGETYKLPVKGAIYKVTIPENAVYDEANNGNESFYFTETAKGVEAPQIRIFKPVYEIDYNAWTTGESRTKKANAYMSNAQIAKIKISCRTPNAILTYSKTESESEPVEVNEAPRLFETKTADPDLSTDYIDYTGEAKLGETKAVDTYGNAKGLKIAIAAKSKNGDSEAESYESANRTVLKFEVSGSYSVQGNLTDNYISNAGIPLKNKDDEDLTFGDLKVWIIGGDAPSGTNSLEPFPLSWGDSSYFKLMQENKSNKNDEGHYYGNFFWVTWDISAPTYHGFVIGDIPSDVEKGPSVWFVGECAWVPQKKNYVLYPGETLVMQIIAGKSYGTTFLFRYKNKGTR